MSLKIEVGKFYRTAEGFRAYVACDNAPFSEYKFVGWINRDNSVAPATSAWTLRGASNTNAKKDLVAEWIDKPVVDWSKEREWVVAVAMDQDGRWWRHDEVPVVATTSWLSADGESHFCQGMHPSEYPAFTGDWKHSLVIRPGTEGGAL